MTEFEKSLQEFGDIFLKLTTDHGIMVRKSVIKEGEPPGFMIVNPRDKRNRLFLDITGKIYTFHHGGSPRMLHDPDAGTEEKIDIVLKSFQMGR